MPSPNTPPPQHFIVPPVSSAHENPLPAATVVAPAMPVTESGTLEGTVPLPWPLYPQHLIVPPTSTAHEWSAPAAIWVAPVIPLTVTGTFEPEINELSGM